MKRFALLMGLIANVAVTFPATGQRGRGGVTPPRGDDGVYGALSYRFIGPPGNRVDAVAGISGDAYTYYAGAASGGIWKTSDGGIHWRPIFDREAVSSIGALAVAPSNPNVVWAGTGESFIRSHISMGWGQKPGAFYEWPVKLISQLNYLASEVQSSDRKPTDQARLARALLESELRFVQREYTSLIQADLARLNVRLRARGLGSVSVSQP